MTRETYDHATISLNRVYALKAIKEKIKRELPELEHDKVLKQEVGDAIFGLIQSRIDYEQKHFDTL